MVPWDLMEQSVWSKELINQISERKKISQVTFDTSTRRNILGHSHMHLLNIKEHKIIPPFVHLDGEKICKNTV